MPVSPENRAYNQSIVHDIYINETSPSVIRARQIGDQPIKDSSYVVIDVESTGQYDEYGRILRIALRKYLPDGNHQDYIQTINPFALIPDDILGLTDISPDELSVSPAFGDVKDTIREFMDGCVVVGQHVGHELRPLLYEYSLHDELAPVLPAVSVTKLAGKNLNRYKFDLTLRGLAEKFGVVIDKSTDSVSQRLDLTGEIYRRLVDAIKAKRSDMHLVKDILRRTWPEGNNALTVPFASEHLVNLTKILRVFEYTGEPLCFEYRTTQEYSPRFRRVKVLGVYGRHFRGLDLDHPLKQERTFSINQIVEIV